MAASTDDLRCYFKTFYREGGEFQSAEYEDTEDYDHSWKHVRTGIVVWKDAIDLSTGPGAKELFHYTGEVPFKNITALEKEAAEVWASLKTEGDTADTWWGRGVYGVPKSPDDWADQMELLDNNFRDMMERDLALHGEDYVKRVYPPRASFCIPLLIDPENAYDIAVRPTPEMEAAGQPPGTNLGGKLLNEPGQPGRCCVVLRVTGEEGVTHSRARLLDALRAREAAAQSPHLKLAAKARLGTALRCRGFLAESKSLMIDVLEAREQTLGAEHPDTLTSVNSLGVCLLDMGQLKDAEPLFRKALEARERTLGAEHRDTVVSVNNLAGCLHYMGQLKDAEPLYRRGLESFERTLGAEHPSTLLSVNNLASCLQHMGQLEDAEALCRRALEARERTFGAEHSDTLVSVSNLAQCLEDMGRMKDAEPLFRRALEARERTLGAEHPETLVAVNNLASCLRAMGRHKDADLLTRRSGTLAQRPAERHLCGCLAMFRRS